MKELLKSKPGKMLVNLFTENSWDRQDDETIEDFQKYSYFRMLPDDQRTLNAVATQFNTDRNSIASLATRRNWRKRNEDWIVYQDKLKQKVFATEMADMIRRHCKHSIAIETALLQPVKDFISKMQQGANFADMEMSELFKIVVQSADKYVKIVDVERKSRGLATEIAEKSVDLTSAGEKMKPIINYIVNGPKSPLLLEDTENDAN